MRTLLPFAFVLLAACSVEEDEFSDQYGRTVCKRIHECQLTQYEERYDERSECVDEWAEFADTLLDLGDTFGGEYDPAGAHDCLESIREATCSEFTSSDYDCDLFIE